MRRLVEPILRSLKWSEEEMEWEYPVGGHRPGKVDIALSVQGTPQLFIEAKPPKASLDDFKPQLKYYCQEEHVELGVLTNGIEWQIYYFGELTNAILPIKTIKLHEKDIEPSRKSFEQLLGKDSLLDKSALNLAKKMWNHCILFSVWKELLNQGDDALVRIIRNKIKAQRQTPPPAGEIKNFIQEVAASATISQYVERREGDRQPTSPVRHKEVATSIAQRKKSSTVRVRMFGEESEFASYRAAMIKFVLQACDHSQKDLKHLTQRLANDRYKSTIMAHGIESKPSSLKWTSKRLEETDYWLNVRLGIPGVKKQCDRIRQALSLPEDVLVWLD